MKGTDSYQAACTSHSQHDTGDTLGLSSYNKWTGSLSFNCPDKKTYPAYAQKLGRVFNKLGSFWRKLPSLFSDIICLPFYFKY